MQTIFLLRARGTVAKPVLLKRGMSATIEELLLSAEYIMAGGNHNVILCERGIRTFETATRNTLDIAAIPVIKNFRTPHRRRSVALERNTRQSSSHGLGRRLRPELMDCFSKCITIRNMRFRRRAVAVFDQFEKLMANYASSSRSRPDHRINHGCPFDVFAILGTG